MMSWYQIVSYLFTNGIRLLLEFFFVSEIMRFSKVKQKTFFQISLIVCICTLLSVLNVPQIVVIGLEIAIFIRITHYNSNEQTRLILFLIFFYEIFISLWEYIVSSALGVFLKDNIYSDVDSNEYIISVWIVRLLVFFILLIAKRKAKKYAFQVISAACIISMLSIILLSEQNTAYFNSDKLLQWAILSIILVVSIISFNLSRQNEMKNQILKLKEEQTELLERDYKSLNQIYTSNAKLYHDINNHLEAIYQYIKQGQTQKALNYLDDLRSPIRDVIQNNWTKDEAVDFLINSKVADAERMGIKTKVNVEFPQHTSIKSSDLIIILGNLLDNAIESAQYAEEGFRFITLTVRRINDMLVIKVENGFAVSPIFDNDGIQTSKSDKLLHGWGLKSAQTAAEHYDGTISNSIADHTFKAIATLSYNLVE